MGLLGRGLIGGAIERTLEIGPRPVWASVAKAAGAEEVRESAAAAGVGTRGCPSGTSWSGVRFLKIFNFRSLLIVAFSFP